MKKGTTSSRKPSAMKPAASRKLKAALGFGRGNKRGSKRNPEGLSLKQLARQLKDPELLQLASDWFYNKRVNPSNPNLAIGATRKKKSKNSGAPK